MRQLNEFGDECKAIYFIRDQQTMRFSQLESTQKQFSDLRSKRTGKLLSQGVKNEAI